MLEIINLHKRFDLRINGEKRIEGCRGINIMLSKGEFVSILGPSGAGKSTILKCIYRSYLPTEGDIFYESIEFGKVNLVKLPEREILTLRREEIGYVSQFLRVIPRVKAIDVVLEPLLVKNNLSYEDAKLYAEELLIKMKIPRYLFDSYPSTFSGGEQQRINIARAVIWKPRLLLLDEPTASLDSKSVNTVLSILSELKNEGTGILAVFHDEELAKRVSDRIYRVS